MVNTRGIAEEYRLTHWAQIMQERIQSGLTVKAFCQQIGICGNTYFYWQRKLREATCKQMEQKVSEITPAKLPEFAKIRIAEAPNCPALPEVPSSPGQLHIELDGMRISIDSTYPSDKLAALLRELRRSC